jgi:hypothetical protein
MVTPSRATSAQVILTVGPGRLSLTPPGDSHSFQVPFDAGAFDPLRSTVEPRSNAVEVQGQALWSVAFAGALGPLLDGAAMQADDVGVTLRVVPAADLQPHLHWIAWETLFDSSRRDFLALKSGWSVVRGPDPFQQFRRLRDGPLDVLVLDLTAAGEVRTAEASTIEAQVGERGTVRLEVRPGAERLTTLLAAHPARIVHMITSGQGEGLVLHAGDGGTDFVDGRAIAQALQDNPQVGLVVLSGGSTALVAETVARTAEVTVLAHRTDVRRRHAALLTEVFYRELFDGIPADVAVTEARRALDRRFPGERAWASAVLLTGWPPPALSTGGTDSGRPGLDAPTAESLIHLLHTTNLARVQELLDIVDWQPLHQQLHQAQQGLDPGRPG